MKIAGNQTLLMIGDSITDCGRGRPVGMYAGLGNGYVSFVAAQINAVYPDAPVRVLNTGISGNRVTDLKARWTEDVIAHNPNWLSIMIGINDVWRQHDRPLEGDQVGIGLFETTLEELIEETRPTLDGLILMSPYFLETNRQDCMRALMDEYGAVVRDLAGRHSAVFVDTQAAFDRYLASRPSQTLCGDRVHPNTVGHMILARAFLQAIDFDWDRS